jgi:hypothetical protein
MDPNFRAPTGRPTHPNPVIERRLEKAYRRRIASQMSRASLSRESEPSPQAIALAFVLAFVASAAALALVHLNQNCRGSLASCPPFSKAR